MPIYASKKVIRWDNLLDFWGINVVKFSFEEVGFDNDLQEV